MNKKCPGCNLINFADSTDCKRCGAPLDGSVAASGPGASVVAETSSTSPASSSFPVKLAVRGGSLVVAIMIALFGLYVTLLVSAKKLDYYQGKTVETAIFKLDERGFAGDARMLRYLTAYRATDNWLNASTREENAYAATNFPFEIMTVYPDFFKVPQDDTERAAVLLHEARHLRGADEKEAYEYVWRNRNRLGWTKARYSTSVMWLNVRKQTKEFVPELFTCPDKEYGDCTE